MKWMKEMIEWFITSSNPRFPVDFIYQFHTEDSIYYKTEIASSLDSVFSFIHPFIHVQQYGDIHATINDLQSSILHTIAEKLQQLGSVLLDVSSAIAEIDVLLAWSCVSRDCNFVRPQLSDEFVIVVKVV